MKERESVSELQFLKTGNTTEIIASVLHMIKWNKLSYSIRNANFRKSNHKWTSNLNNTHSTSISKSEPKMYPQRCTGSKLSVYQKRNENLRHMLTVRKPLRMDDDPTSVSRHTQTEKARKRYFKLQIVVRILDYAIVNP